MFTSLSSRVDLAMNAEELVEEGSEKRVSINESQRVVLG
jgi:hypothetical protein